VVTTNAEHQREFFIYVNVKDIFLFIIFFLTASGVVVQFTLSPTLYKGFKRGTNYHANAYCQTDFVDPLVP
jgi:hypothetical protein